MKYSNRKKSLFLILLILGSSVSQPLLLENADEQIDQNNSMEVAEAASAPDSTITDLESQLAQLISLIEGTETEAPDEQMAEASAASEGEQTDQQVAAASSVDQIGEAEQTDTTTPAPRRPAMSNLYYGGMARVAPVRAGGYGQVRPRPATTTTVRTTTRRQEAPRQRPTYASSVVAPRSSTTPGYGKQLPKTSAKQKVAPRPASTTTPYGRVAPRPGTTTHGYYSKPTAKSSTVKPRETEYQRVVAPKRTTTTTKRAPVRQVAVAVAPAYY
jgi:hypothetical protein